MLKIVTTNAFQVANVNFRGIKLCIQVSSSSIIQLDKDPINTDAEMAFHFSIDLRSLYPQEDSDGFYIREKNFGVVSGVCGVYRHRYRNPSDNNDYGGGDDDDSDDATSGRNSVYGENYSRRVKAIACLGSGILSVRNDQNPRQRRIRHLLPLDVHS